VVTLRPLDLEPYDPRGDPADIVAAADAGASERVAALLAALHPEWHEHAACRGEPVTVFFPERTAGRNPYGRALELCGRCSVREECADEALADPTLDFGVRGGMTADARRARRRNTAARTRNRPTEED
jgi:hypothetical protein